MAGTLVITATWDQSKFKAGLSEGNNGKGAGDTA